MVYIIKKKTFIILLILIIIILFIMQSNSIYSFKTFTSINNKYIIIDPGHGGRDPGALGDLKKPEKDINLSISLKLKELLEQNGFPVILTRAEDVSIHDENAKNKKASDLNNRKKIINENSTKLVISIHLNSFPQKKYYGAQVFYSTTFLESKQLGESIQLELKKFLDINNERQAKPISNVILLKNLKVPAVIVECGFLSNPNEEILLNTENYQQKIAMAIYSGAVKFLSQQPPNVNN